MKRIQILLNLLLLALSLSAQTNNKGADPKALGRLALQAPWVLPPEGLSFHLINQRILFETQALDGQALDAAFDSGASLAILDVKYLDSFEHEDLATSMEMSFPLIRGGNAGGRYPLQRIKNFSWNGVPLGDLVAAVVDIDLGIPLVVGVAPFRTQTISLLFSERRIIPGIRAGMELRGTGYSFGDFFPQLIRPMMLIKHPSIEKRLYHLYLDTGSIISSRNFLLPHEEEGRSALGSPASPIVLYESLELPGLVLEKVPGFVVNRPDMATAAYLGMSTLKQYNWIFDFVNRIYGPELPIQAPRP